MAEELENVQGQEQEIPPVENENAGGVQDEPVPETPTVFIALTKNKGKKKILVGSMEGYETGYTVDGIYVTDGTHAIIIAIDEQTLPFGGSSEDLQPGDELYDVASPSMSSFDGAWRTDFLMSFMNPAEGTALPEAKKQGWLPSGGEMALIAAKKEEVNMLLEAVGGTVLSDDYYWTSQKFSNDRMWSCDMADGKFTLNNGNTSSLAVRPVKSAAGYAEVES